MQATLIPYLPRDMTLCLLPTPRSPNDSSTVNRNSRHYLPRSGSINHQAMKRQREECDACPDQMTVLCRTTGRRMHQPSPLIFAESNMCCNCNFKVNTSPTAEWSETMPRLARSDLVCLERVSRNIAPYGAYRAEDVRSRSRKQARPASARIRPGAPGSGAAPRG